MELVVCSACRRHVRSDTPGCPFCGGRSFAALRPLVHVRMTRGAVATLATAGIAVLGEACAASSRSVYGGPADDDSNAVQVLLQTDQIALARKVLREHGSVAGCKVVRESEPENATSTLCANGVRVSVYLVSGKVEVVCNRLTRTECSATWDRIVEDAKAKP